MDTSKILSIYERMMHSLLTYKVNDETKDELCCMANYAGSAYTGKLMIFGRAVNGWENNWNNTDQSLIPNILLGVDNDFQNGNLNWVKLQPVGKYNPKKSSFWRMSNRLGEYFTGAKPGADGIVWSNLYKVANRTSGNPSNALKTAQLKFCQEIFFEEIAMRDPKLIVIFAGMNWAKDFVINNAIKKIDLVAFPKMLQFVEFAGEYKEKIIIVTKHPERKPEMKYFEEIKAVYDWVLTQLV